ncbi:hypothetical protein [Actinophytocola sp.]|uniref:hypothetical protein n=1 Tax=Actinophytocola sp. TaxID=1872138 RepID=UPI002D58D126|nr:hypothetical protein [Actinophytocola sp.]HYQ68109.1 hypothetical protein [Actinophytocola sp.]
MTSWSIDAAHAALARTEGQCRLTIPAGHDAFMPLFDLFVVDLIAQNRKACLDITGVDGYAVVRVPFWVWRTGKARSGHSASVRRRT